MTRRVILERIGISQDVEPRLVAFRALFERWNRSINLSAASSAIDIDHHIDDSLHVVPLLSGCHRVLDVGAGGGFPSVVVAICLPNTEVTALEPVHKKHAFLRTAARELGLANLVAWARRLEDHADRDYDAAMSRATFDLGEWLARGVEVVRPSGVVLGFEAIERDDLPMSVERHRYVVDGKARSIVVARRDP
jgi:16S rRNA (guanine527-N7)-methyltransferase